MNLDNANELNDLSEIRKIKRILETDKIYNSESTIKSGKMGGHIELEKKSDIKSICPSAEFVDNLLKSCGKKLGIDYVAR